MLICGVTFNVLDWNGDVLSWIVRILIAALCGFAIGFERKSRSKEAGIRTHAIVCMAAALMIIVSKYGFTDLFGASTDASNVGAGTRGADPARIAAQVVSGIGFLGAGIIFVRRDILHGLTTAAGIWATAGIGMAIGAGLIIVGVTSAALLVFLQILLHRPLKIFRQNTHIILRISAYISGPEDIEKLKQIFDVKKFLQFRTSRNESGTVADVEITTLKQFTPADLYNILSANPFIKSIEENEEM